MKHYAHWVLINWIDLVDFDKQASLMSMHFSLNELAVDIENV